MTLDKDRSNYLLMEDWFKVNSFITEDKAIIFKELIKQFQGDLSLFYEMNKTIVIGEGQVLDNETGINFISQNDKCMLKTNYGEVYLSNIEFRKVIAGIVDIYEDIYPLGTVVDLDKKYFRNILPVDEVDELRVVITYRFIPLTDTCYIPYVGSLYPVGNMGILKNDIHFTPRAIERVVQMGYQDEKELAFIYQIKNNFLIHNGKHSSGFANNEEIDEMRKVFSGN